MTEYEQPALFELLEPRIAEAENARCQAFRCPRSQVRCHYTAGHPGPWHEGAGGVGVVFRWSTLEGSE